MEKKMRRSKFDDFDKNEIYYLNSINSIHSSRSLPPSNIQNYEFDDMTYNESAEIAELKLKIAGQRIFSSLLLYAYRSRGKEINNLRQNLRGTTSLLDKTKNQIHVKNAMFSAEKSHNDNLIAQLNGSVKKLTKTQATCDKLNIRIKHLELEKKKLETALKEKARELDELNAMHNQTKSEIYRSMYDQRKIQTHLCNEQRNVKHLENQNSELILEINEYISRNEQLEAEYRKQQKEKNQEINKANNTIEHLKKQLEGLIKEVLKNEELKVKEVEMEKEMELLKKEQQELKKITSWLPTGFLYPSWQWWWNFQKHAFYFIHVIAFLLLPAFPCPSLGNMSILEQKLFKHGIM